MKDPKDYAKELVEKYYNSKDENGWHLCEFESCAIECALITIEKILEFKQTEFLEDVKTEINNLKINKDGININGGLCVKSRTKINRL